MGKIPSPQDIAARFRAIRDAYLEKYMATLDQYASRSGPRNSPGQLGLLNGGEPLRSSKTQQKLRWITVHPPGHEKGQPVLIDDKGTVQGGMGGKFTGKKISELGNSNKPGNRQQDEAENKKPKQAYPEPQSIDDYKKLPPYAVYMRGGRFNVKVAPFDRMTGDTIHSDEADAVSTSKREAEREAGRKEIAEREEQKQKAAADKEDAEKAAYKGFHADSPMRFGKAKTALDKLIRSDGQVMSKREWVEKLHAAGWQKGEDGHLREPGKSADQAAYLKLTPTEMSYFNHLGNLAQPPADAGQGKGRVGQGSADASQGVGAVSNDGSALDRSARSSNKPPNGLLRNPGDAIAHPEHYYQHIRDVGSMLGEGFYSDPGSAKPRALTPRQMAKELALNTRFGDGLRLLLQKTGYFTDGRFFVDASRNKEEILGDRPVSPDARVPNFAQILEGHKVARPAKPVAYSDGNLSGVAKVVLETVDGNHVTMDRQFMDTIKKMHGNVQWHATTSDAPVYAKIGSRVVGGAMPMSGDDFSPKNVMQRGSESLPLERGNFTARIDAPRKERGKMVSNIVFQTPQGDAAFAHAEKTSDGWVLYTGLPGRAKTLNRIVGPIKNQAALKSFVETLANHVTGVNADNLPVFTEKKTMSQSDRYSAIKAYLIERYTATLDQYASKSGPRNSPGQLGLFSGDQPLRSSKTQQKFRWITVHPPGHEKGQPVLIDGEGRVQGGMGGKFTGKKIGEIGKGQGSDSQKPGPKQPSAFQSTDSAAARSKDHRASAIAKALDFIKRAGHVTTGAQAEMQAGNAWFTLDEDQRGAFSGHKEFARAVGKAFVGRTEPNGTGDEPTASDEPVETPQPKIPAEFDPTSLTQEQLDERVKNAPSDMFATSRQEDWGSGRGQGKRVGKMVLGSMSAAPRGVKTYVDIVGKLPESERAELTGLEKEERETYAKARAAGLNHDQAFLYTLEYWGHTEKGTTLERIKQGDTSQPAKPKNAQPDATPRERAKAEAEAQDADYEFARKSAIPNAGEDLKGSARHSRNAWRSLEEAEADGSAELLVTRDNLLKNEPHELGLHVDKSPITTLLMHQALKSFPPAPGYKGRSRDTEAAKKDRSDYLDAYRNIKKAAEKIAASGMDDPREASQKLGRAVTQEIARLRAGDRYNSTANALVNMANGLTQTYRKSAIVRKVGEFALELKAKSQGPESMRERVIDAVHDVLEGKSFSQVLGKTGQAGKGREKGFNAADLYVAIAEREGGPKIEAKTAKESLDYLVDKVGLRGVQFGNSVSDAEREHHAKMAAGAMVDLASVLGLPVDAVSLDGSLGLAMGARGRGGALAHYEPDSKVINLTRKKGVGSLAHEWAHALDHHLGGGTSETVLSGGKIRSMSSFMSDTPEMSYVGRREGGKFVSSKVSHTDKPVYKEMFALKKAMKDSGYDSRLRTAIRDHGVGKKASYWQSSTEKFARCFERYVQRKLEKEDRKNTYLAGIDTKAYKSGGLWPTDEEVDAMAPAFEALMDAYRKERLKMDEPAKYSAQDRAFWTASIATRMLSHERRVAEIRQAYVDRYMATLEAKAGRGAWVDRYRVGSPSGPKPSPGKSSSTGKRKESEKSQVTTGSFGDRGRFVTLDDGRVIFLKSDNTVERGPKELRGTQIDSSRIKQPKRGPRNPRNKPFVPKTTLDHAIVEIVGKDPDDVKDFREIVKQMHNLAMEEWSEEVDALRNVLGHSRDMGGFVSKVKRSQSDAASVKNFDELVDDVKTRYPQLLGRQGGSTDKGGDDAEGALWDRLKRGFPERPTKHSPKVLEMATEMWDSLREGMGSTEESQDNTERILVDPNDPFSDYVPFAASFARQVIDRYHAGIA